jgi:hypothetical protein
MSKSEVIYRRTEAGAAVAAAEDPEIPEEYRRILRFLEVESYAIMVRKLLRQHGEELVSQWLEELEELKLIESLPATAELDPEYTDRLQVAQIAAAYKKSES